MPRWTKVEDNAALTMSAKLVSQKYGRNIGAILARRRKLGLGTPEQQARCKARNLGLKRKYFGDPKLEGQFELIDQIKMRAKEDGVPIYKLDSALKCGHYFRDGARHRKKVNLRFVAAAVEYFGGTMVIDWRDR